MARLTVADNGVELARLAAERVTQLIVEAAANRGRALVSLAGGNTPQRLYVNLADPQQPWRDRIPWPQVHLFWGDERHVPPDHPDSNYGMAKASLIDHVPTPADHVHRIRAELPDAREVAAEYDALVGRISGTESFDLTLLGLGEDAHIASLFPGSPLLDRPDGPRVAAVWAPHLNVWRITLTPSAILNSARILLVVTGGSKAEAVNAALEARLDVKDCPAQLLRAAGDRVEWFLDGAAAAPL